MQNIVCKKTYVLLIMAAGPYIIVLLPILSDAGLQYLSHNAIHARVYRMLLVAWLVYWIFINGG